MTRGRWKNWLPGDNVTDTCLIAVYTLCQYSNWIKGDITMGNVGGIDRALRIIVGLALISLVFVGPQVVWGWVGLVPLLTGLFRFCPAYTLLGIKTCKTS
jgi:hypothetical protein